MKREQNRRKERRAGFTLLELMIAMVVLAIGLGGLSTLFISAAASNTKNSRSTTATMLAQYVVDAITAQPANGTVKTITVTDCAGNIWEMNTAGAATPSGAGATLVTSSSGAYYGTIDPTQDYSTLPPASSASAGYGMKYVECAVSGDQPVIYDVRWNVITIDSNTRLVTVSARQLSQSNQLGTAVYAFPVTVRGIGGS